MSKRKRSSAGVTRKERALSSSPSSGNLYIWAGAITIVLLVLIVYFNSLSGGFIFDDDLLLTNNDALKSSNALYKIWCTDKLQDYWPVTNTTLWLEWHLWEMHPAGYRIVNLFLHIVEVLLIWLILRKLSIPGAFLAAIVFAVHPVNVESVAWIASLKNLLAMLFFLLAIWFYLK
jgi:protein O-mannosyl-transferase